MPSRKLALLDGRGRVDADLLDPAVKLYGEAPSVSFLLNAPLVAPAGTSSQIQATVHISSSSGDHGMVTDTNHIHPAVDGGLWWVQSMQTAIDIPAEMPQADLDAHKVHLDPFWMPGVEFRHALVAGEYNNLDLLVGDGAGPGSLCLFSAPLGSAYHYWARNLSDVDITIAYFAVSMVRLAAFSASP